MEDFAHNGSSYVFKGGKSCVVDGIWNINIFPYDEEREAEWVAESGAIQPVRPIFRAPTIEEMHQDHYRRKTTFEASDEWKLLKTHLKAEQEKGLEIDQIVALGMGTSQIGFDEPGTDGQMQNEAAVLSTLMNFLSKSNLSSDSISLLTFLAIRSYNLYYPRPHF